MVLRKPYAFLIKHFRLIHLIITLMFTLLVIKNREVYKYLKLVINDSVNKYDALSYINYNIYINILIALVLCFIVYYLLKYKDKPRRIYIFTIAGYIIVGIFMFILYGYMRGFSNNIVDQKTIRLYRDLLSMTLFFQYYTIIVMLIRGLGFDIKKFNFNRDVQELNLNSSDAEEVEINTQIDTTNIMRGIRKQRREFGYFFQEYKAYIIVILIIVLAIAGYNIYNYLSVKYKVYNENELIGVVNNVIVKDSYYSIDGENNYVIINFDIFKAGKMERLNTGNMVLLVGNQKYTPDKNICYKYSKLGNCYKKQYISNNRDNYILTYKVDNLNIQNVYLIYSESYDNSYKVKLILKETSE